MYSKTRAAAELALLYARQSSRAVRSAHTGTDVVLEQVVEKLGETGQRVTVSRGFARNHLVPNNLARAVPKEVARRPPRSLSGDAAGAASVARAQVTTTSQLQLSAALDTLGSSPVELLRRVKGGTKTALAQPVTAACIAKAVMRQKRVALAPQMLSLEQPLCALGQPTVPLRMAGASGERATLQVSIAGRRRAAGGALLSAPASAPPAAAEVAAPAPAAPAAL